MTHTIPYTLTRGDEEIEIEVEYSVGRYYAAQTYGPPEHCSPAEGGEIEELFATLDGEEITLTNAEQAKIETFIYATHDYADDDDDDDYFED